MITNGFTYIAVLVFIAALLVWLQRYTKSKFFDYAPPIVLLYLITMILCTLGAWDMEATKPAYSVLKNNLLYAMIFLMLLRCDIRKIITIDCNTCCTTIATSRFLRCKHTANLS